MNHATWHVPASARVFLTTQWGVIAACRQSDETRARAALTELCLAYWKPVYCCVRHQGYPIQDAQDLTQEFFLHLLKGAWLEQLNQEKGRFRAYLSTALRNFLRKRWRRTWTLRRGRGFTLIPVEAITAERDYASILVAKATPGSLYERQWACAVIEQTLLQLKIEMRAAGKELLYDHFDAILTAGTRGFSFEDLAKSANVTVGALHVALHRWRRRYHALLREEIARTVFSRDEIDDELRHLSLVFSRSD